MSEEIKIGEYVRTLDGNIGKIEQINKEPTDDTVIYVVTDNWVGMYEEIVKHSKNIIDLIEVGDYVNGYKVVDIMEDMKTGELHLEMTSDYTNQEIGDCTIYNKNIKSIVTKEQFKEMEYKV
jgi:hypothetical protein